MSTQNTPTSNQGCAGLIATVVIRMCQADPFVFFAIPVAFVLGLVFVHHLTSYYLASWFGLIAVSVVAGLSGRKLGVGEDLMRIIRTVAARIARHPVAQSVGTSNQEQMTSQPQPNVTWAGQSPSRPSTANDRATIADLERTLRERIIGQDIAVDLIVRALRRQAAGTDPDTGKRPTSFLFIGPTGTGKTELVKAVAQALGRGDLLRYDLGQMSSGTAHGDPITWTLFGSPQGYIGGEGTMTSAVAANPHAVLLLDEIEKGSPTFFDSFLAILDEGSAKDNRTDKRVSFARTLVFMTSNLVTEVPDAVYEEPDRARDYVLMARFLRPEFLNRISYVVPFRPLAERDIRRIAQIQLERYLAAFCRQKRCEPKVKIEQPVIDLLVSRTDRKYGVRDLERAIKSQIADPLTDAVLDHGAGGRITRLDIVARDGRVRVEVS
jgi:ATP-dependent Clp protease ATP-binding subunit ClpC